MMLGNSGATLLNSRNWHGIGGSSLPTDHRSLTTLVHPQRGDESAAARDVDDRLAEKLRGVLNVPAWRWLGGTISDASGFLE